MENSFNINLKRIRKEKGITQEQLADKVGVSPQAVSKWELSSYPDPQLFPAIADFLGVTIDELFGRAPEKEMSVHTRAMLELYDMPQSDDSSQKRLKFAYDLVRASIMGCCGCNIFGDIPDNVQNSTYDNHTLCLRDAGFIFGRLNANLPFMLVMPEPEKGYDDVLAMEGKAKEAILLAEKGLPRSENEKQKATLRAVLCFLYLQNGEGEKALALASSLPHTRESREVIKPKIEGELSAEALHREIRYLILGE